MKKYIVITLLSVTLFGCFEDNDDNSPSALESALNVKDFIWKGMNTAYLYKDEIPDLANDRFLNATEYTLYINSYASPESLFSSLIYEPQTVDRFSYLIPNYIVFEQQLDGISVSNGLELNLYRVPNSDTEIFAAVRLVLPNSAASAAGMQRGNLITTVNGTTLTLDNWRSLLRLDTYTLGLATYNDNGTETEDDDTLDTTGQSIGLTKTPYTENPIYLNSILTAGGNSVGYIMYNGFIDNYDAALNTIFTNFAANGVQHLVVDLRYNPGGSVNTAILLSSMITGQFTGELFAKQQWNSEQQALISAQNPESLNYRFTNMYNGAAISSLNLNKVYVLTTGATASASELLINSLRPYIDVVQIGTTTVGKSQASITLYDSPNFRRQDVNPNHTYAIQPLIFTTENKDGAVVPSSGLVPNIELGEDYKNYGVLGNATEPLLARALEAIENGKTSSNSSHKFRIVIGNSDDLDPNSRLMISDVVVPQS